MTAPDAPPALPPFCARCQTRSVERTPTGAPLAYCGEACRAASMRDYEAGAHRAAEAAACLGEWDAPVAPRVLDAALRERLRSWRPEAAS